MARSSAPSSLARQSATLTMPTALCGPRRERRERSFASIRRPMRQGHTGSAPTSWGRLFTRAVSQSPFRPPAPAAHSFDPLRLLGDVVGARAYASGEAPRISGIAAHGDTLVIRLIRASSDLPARLALPSFCAVPAELPTVPHGLPYPIPSAGPYYLADRSSDVLVLKQ